jgi:hypothetical protein
MRLVAPVRFAFQQKSLICTQGQGDWVILVRDWSGMTEGFLTRNPKKEGAPREDGRQRPGRVANRGAMGVLSFQVEVIC